MPRRALALVALLLATPAAAHQIDGDWCSPLGQHIRVGGGSAVTPGGQEVAALGDRHVSSFTLPEGEEGEGGLVLMQVMGDDRTALVKIGEGPITQWSRCEMVS